MIKIKICNPVKDRNEVIFRPFSFIQSHLQDYSIELTNSDDFDFLFIGMSDFWDMSLTLEDSVDWGLNNIESLTQGGDYFLFDGSDSTSLMGAYEVFDQSNAIYLLKNQLLPNREDYKTSYAFNKFFFGKGSDLDLSYDIPEKKWNRIKFSHINLGYWNDLKNFKEITEYLRGDKFTLIASSV